MKVVLSLVALGIATIPLDLFLLARWVFQPQGFWQNLALTGIGIFALGGIQIIFLVLLISFLVESWKN